ncbi:MAG: restriction endonuclease [Gaiellaceae bacterium]
MYTVVLFLLGFIVQFVEGGRSGDVFFKFMMALPFVFSFLAGVFIVDLGCGAYLRLRGHPFRFRLLRRAWYVITGPPPPRQIAPEELRTLQQLEMLTASQFELAVGDLMKEMGFKRVRQLGGSGDLGVDLTARDAEGRTVAVQCKKWDSAGTVGSRDLQLFIGMTTTHHRTDRAIFVSTASYTKPASDLARQHSIELWDGAELSRLVTLYRGEPTAEVDGRAGFAALEKADAKLRQKEEREMKKATEEAERQEQYLHEHTSSAGFFLPDAALDLARESAADRALRRRHPGREPSDEEMDELIATGSPAQPAKRCEDCGQKVPWNEMLPGHYCYACGRAELWIADERKVMSVRSKKRRRFEGAR